jgi:hypothetical protein
MPVCYPLGHTKQIARNADRYLGMGEWKKRRSSCNERNTGLNVI